MIPYIVDQNLDKDCRIVTLFSEPFDQFRVSYDVILQPGILNKL